MITEKQLFEIGFRRYGDEEKDPFYKIVLIGDVFDITQIAGNFNNVGNFIIYSIKDREFKNINEIKEIMNVCRFKVNWNIVNRYGSSTPL
jgi:hypothetical protein